MATASVILYLLFHSPEPIPSLRKNGTKKAAHAASFGNAVIEEYDRTAAGLIIREKIINRAQRAAPPAMAFPPYVFIILGKEAKSRNTASLCIEKTHHTDGPAMSYIRSRSFAAKDLFLFCEVSRP